MNSWKEQLAEVWKQRAESPRPISLKESTESFISTEIIEKLIADIPDDCFSMKESEEESGYVRVQHPNLKQQLRDKWL
jgi:hypothetical protein